MDDVDDDVDEEDDNDVSRRGKVQSKRTKTWKGQEPDWDETLELDVHPDDAVLEINVWYVVNPLGHFATRMY